MAKLLKNLYNEFINKELMITICFGLLLLLYWNGIGSCVRIIVAALSDGMVKVLDTDSSNWCERSVGAMVQCHRLGIYACIPPVILASLLYFKHKKLAFCCLLLPLLFFLLVETILI